METVKNETSISDPKRYYNKNRKEKFCTIQVPKSLRDDLKAIADLNGISMVLVIKIMINTIKLAH